jgi:hypothetical protein
MKNILLVAAIMFLGMVKAETNIKPSDTNDLHVIMVSKSQWTDIKNNVDTNGFCRIPDQHAAIVITNGLPDVELVVPMLRPIGRGADRNPYYNYRKQEPLPYVGQLY